MTQSYKMLYGDKAEIKGPVSLMLAGESAAYSFEMARVDYEMHSVR